MGSTESQSGTCGGEAVMVKRRVFLLYVYGDNPRDGVARDGVAGTFSTRAEAERVGRKYVAESKKNNSGGWLEYTVEESEITMKKKEK